MPAAAVPNPPWATGSWTDTCWENGTWGPATAVVPTITPNVGRHVLDGRATGHLTDLLRRPDHWVDLPIGTVVPTPARLGNRFRVYLTADTTIEPPHYPHNGQSVLWRFQQDTAGGHAVTFNSFDTVGDLPAVDTTANAVSFIEAIYDEVSETWELLGFPDLSGVYAPLSHTHDHGADLTGLSDDDHTQYLLKSGLREWDEQGSDPAVPASTKWKLYFKSGGLYLIDDGGTVTGPLIDSAGATTDHGALTGLSDDDHSQYLLVDGTRAMTGSLNMGTNPIDAVTTIYLAQTTKTADYTATAADHTILADSTSGDVTITLPAGTGKKRYIIKKMVNSNAVYVAGTSGEVFDRGSRLDLTNPQESVMVEWDSTNSEWVVLFHTIWTQPPTYEFPVMMGAGVGDELTADGNAGLGVSYLQTYSDTRNRTVAPIDGEIHSLKVEISGTAVGAGEDWTVTLYKNGVATALTATIGEAATSATDSTNRISVVAGDTLYFNIDETGTLNNQMAISVIYESKYQPMFGNGDSGGAIRYGSVQTGQYSGSGTREIVTLFPCAGTLRNFYVDSPSCDTSGDEVTLTLETWDSGTSSWSSTGVSIVLNFNSDGSSLSDLVSTYNVSAGEVLQWKYESTGGSVSRTSVSCEFRPSEPGDRIVTGSIDTYEENDADVYGLAMGNGNDFAASGTLGSNISISNSGTAQDLYVETVAAPGATGKWIEVTVQKDGVDTSLTARVTDPAVANSDTSSTVGFTKQTNDIGVNITNSGDTPDAQLWVAWGFVLRP